VRIFNLFRNTNVIINVNKYKTLFGKRREFEELYNQYINQDTEMFIKDFKQYKPVPWNNRCNNCSLNFICHSYS
jgi:CRISPR/Cas system-associated exonuclease Cas4 (RecB family)